MNTPASCLIIEDDTTAAEMAKDIILSNFPEVQILATVPDITSASAQLNQLKPDFVLLDINLEDGDAFTLLQEFEKIWFKIIFVTSFDTYAVEAFKYSALDYLLKPYAPDALVKAVQKVLTELDKENYTDQIQALFHNMGATATEKKLVLKNLDVIHVVAINDIIYVQSDNNYVTFFLEDGKKIVVSKTLKSFEEQLKMHHFFRIHQSYLINLNYITSFDKRSEAVVLTDTISLPVAQSKKKMLFNYLNALS